MISHEKPLIVQSDSSLLLDVHCSLFEDARAHIALFAELEKSPDHIHTYRVSPLSLWNAASVGITGEAILDILRRYSRYPIPQNIPVSIGDVLSRYGKIRLQSADRAGRLFLEVTGRELIEEIKATRKLNALLEEREGGFLLDPINRGTIKQELIRIGYPVHDAAPLVEGDRLILDLRVSTLRGASFELRDYQVEAADAFLGLGVPGTGFGTVVLPCGAGKTIVGILVMARLKTNTLILVTNVAAVHQWIDELVDKTGVSRDEIGEYTGDRKEIRPITVATYNILVWRKRQDEEFPHFQI
ncbi:MAG TPA: helicase-associated domain-containing protein, partial [Spirochaetia bacterium]|nr:helicase-associated domain-containing protein [Spirochaetia bacterium]